MDEVMRLLEVNAYRVYVASLDGGSKINGELFAWLKDVSVGNLVMEVSALHSEGITGKRIGWLEKITREPFPNCDPADYAPDPIPEETVHYLKLLDGTTMRWTNASFVNVLTRFHGFSWKRTEESQQDEKV